ncbi:MAG TPA: hypothetical protein VF988_09665 [Verrucomicrobiae bacterium]
MIAIPALLQRGQKACLAVGLLLALACAMGLIFMPRPMLVSWLFSFVFWLGLSLGCLNVAMVHYLTGGRWGDATRRIFEAAYMTLPLMAILFVPLLFGLRELYPWAQPTEVLHNKILQARAAYNTPIAFTLRALFFFGIWVALAVRLRSWSLQQDLAREAGPTIRMRAWSGPGIVVVPLTITFALVDWVMSLEAEWYSTIFGVILLAGQFLAALAFATIILAVLRRAEPFATHFVQGPTEKTFHDLGNLLLTFVMFWTYVAFSQLLIIYSGNQPHEIGWYLRRIGGSWKVLIGLVAAFHFFVPFCLLLLRAAKTNITSLTAIAAMLFLVHALEIFWVIAPEFYPHGISVHWTDFAAWLGIGGLWLAVFVGNLNRHPLLPLPPAQLNPPTALAHAK